MALDLRLDVAMPDAATDAATWLDPARYWPALDRGHRGTSTLPSAPCTSAALPAQRARHAAPRGGHADPRREQVGARPRRGRGAARAARLPRRARLHARRGAVARRHGRRRRGRLSRRRSAAASADSAATPTSRAASRSWSTRRSSSTSSTPCCRPARREDDPRVPRARRLVARARCSGTSACAARPVHDPADAGALAEDIVAPARLPARRHDVLRGADRRRREPPGGPPDRRRREPLDAVAARCPSSSSAARAAVAAVREHADLEFVNGGGTGSLELTAADRVDHRDRRRLRPVRRRTCSTATRTSPRRPPRRSRSTSCARRAPTTSTMLGGGWIASGPPGRRPAAAHRLARGAHDGRVASRPARCRRPSPGAAARDLRAGDRVWFRHTKSGELSEHLNEFAVVDGDAVVDDRARPTGARGRRSCDGERRRCGATGAAPSRCGRCGVERPATAGAVQRAVAAAAASGLRVKPVGAGHSFTGIAVAPDVQLDLDRPHGRDRRGCRDRPGHARRRHPPAPAAATCSPPTASRCRTWATSTGRRSPAPPPPARTAPGSASAASRRRSSRAKLVDRRRASSSP